MLHPGVLPVPPFGFPVKGGTAVWVAMAKVQADTFRLLEDGKGSREISLFGVDMEPDDEQLGKYGILKDF